MVTILLLLCVVAILRKYATLIKAIFGDMKKKMTPVWNAFLAVITSNYSF